MNDTAKEKLQAFVNVSPKQSVKLRRLPGALFPMYIQRDLASSSAASVAVVLNGMERMMLYGLLHQMK
jgi:hypothetical protein